METYRSNFNIKNNFQQNFELNKILIIIISLRKLEIFSETSAPKITYRKKEKERNYSLRKN